MTATINDRKQISSDVIEDLAQAAARRWPTFKANYIPETEDSSPSLDLCRELMSGYLALIGLQYADVERGCTSRLLRRFREIEANA